MTLVSVTRRWGWVAVGSVIVTLLGGHTILAAQEMAAPVEVQVPLLVKTLGFDRNRSEAGERTLVVGVLYQAGNRASAEVAAKVGLALLKVAPLGGSGGTLRVVPIDLDDTKDLGALLAEQGVTALYVSPLRLASLRRITEAARAQRITTLTGVPDYVDGGLAIGIGVQDDRPRIIMNLAASKAEGARFSSQLLHFARLVDHTEQED